MSRWIDYDAIDYKHYQLHDKSEEFLNGVIYMAERIEEAPSIDIVFCKECKHRYDDGWLEPRWTCDYLKDMRLKDDDFCSYGEREVE